MLRELRVENVGVIADLTLVLGRGMTVLTGETGAGKTLVVESIELLLGGRADAGVIRAGAGEARVEGRFDIAPDARIGLADLDALSFLDRGEDEMVLARVVPVTGRSRAYVNGRLVSVGTLRDVGSRLVDLHGQHSHHSLLSPEAQRAALDRFGGEECATALASYRTARQHVLALERELTALGGDDRERAREVDLLSFQIDEIDAAAIESPDEDERLAREEEALASARAIRDGAHSAYAHLEGDVLDGLGAAADALTAPTLEETQRRAAAVQDEVAELVRDLRHIAEQAEEDPARLEQVAARRHALRQLRRKYGETLMDVVGYRAGAHARLRELLDAGARAQTITAELDSAWEAVRSAAKSLTEARRRVATRLGEAIAEELQELGMPGARVEVAVEDGSRTSGNGARSLPVDGLDGVEFRLSANPGEPVRPFARVASGGELARTMLAARVLLTDGAPTLVFDEVDAGIGGQAGVAVGRRLGLVALQHQVLCVTHLAQVAAAADSHVVIDKHDFGGRTEATATPAEGDRRIAELSRMLSGLGTQKARRHAEELLMAASAARGEGA